MTRLEMTKERVKSLGMAMYYVDSAIGSLHGPWFTQTIADLGNIKVRLREALDHAESIACKEQAMKDEEDTLRHLESRRAMEFSWFS